MDGCGTALVVAVFLVLELVANMILNLALVGVGFSEVCLFVVIVCWAWLC
jgi:hypothetical protein